MSLSPLAAKIALRVVEMVETGEVGPGGHLRESMIAEDFRVSRSPVREALVQLAKYKIVKHHRNRGCFVAVAARATLDHARKQLLNGAGDAVYREIAAQRLDGELAEDFTEADLGRQFDLSRAEVGRIVERMALEGWIERRPGYGWAFVPIVTTTASFELSYRFRRAIEPAALLEPTFAPDTEAFARCRSEQQALMQGQIKTTSVGLFQYGSRFHEVLARCSGNPLFLDALQRVNRLRRLLEYRAMDNTRPFTTQAHEHIQILDLVEAGKMAEASALMDRHLDANRRLKLKILNAAQSGVRAASKPKKSRT
jgi:DNA-binding GntR family transcriptional regulator